MSQTHESPKTVAEAYLARLRERGVERLFVNAGTDFPSVVEAYARSEESKLQLPAPVVAAHENLAVGMAHGAYLATGRPQAVMVHVNVGTANALCGLMNAARDRVPILLTAGRTPLTEEGAFGSRSGGIHWAQEMFDQAGMVRELVKWDYELRDALQVETVVDRAASLAMSEPRGPVYLTLPREVLARPAACVTSSLRPLPVPTEAYPSPDAVEELACLLADARFPVIVTAAAGADRRTVPILDRLARRHAIGVLESMPRYVSVPGANPYHLGYRLQTVLAQADVLCFVECDVPWMPVLESPREGTVVVQAGIDPLFSRYPIRSHRSELTITGSPRHLFEALADALAGRRAPVGRAERLAGVAAAVRAKDEESFAGAARRGGAITKSSLNWALAQALPGDSIVVNEYWADPAALRPAEVGSYFRYPPTGGLGWGLPAALGIQQAATERTVVATVGDGAYLFANPAACHQAAAMHDLPVLSVICTNGQWAAVGNATRAMYPQGASARCEEMPLSSLRPLPALERYVQASGGQGEAVSSMSELVPALRRGLDCVRRERRQAVVNVICES